MARKKTTKKVVRKKPTTTPKTKEEKLIDSMEKLTKVMKEMVTLFKTANKQMISGSDPISERLDMLEQQNQKIARGILAVANLVQEKVDEAEEKLEPYEKMYKRFEEKTFGPEEAPGQMPIPGPAAVQPRRMPPPGPRPPQGSMADVYGKQLPEFEKPAEPIERLPAHRQKKKPLPPPPSIPPQ